MGDVEWNVLFDALRDVRRRRVLMALLELDAQREAVQVPEDVHAGDQKLQRLQIELIHQHLPRLDDAEYITWERENHKVRRGPSFDEIRPVLAVLDDHCDELPDGFV